MPVSLLDDDLFYFRCCEEVFQQKPLGEERVDLVHNSRLQSVVDGEVNAGTESVTPSQEQREN